MFYKQCTSTKQFLTPEQLREMQDRLLLNYGFSLEDLPNPNNARQAVQDIRDLLEHISELQTECMKWEHFAANLYRLSMQHSDELGALIEQELGRQEQLSNSN